MEKCFENLIYGGDKESDKEINSLMMQNATAHEICEKMKEIKSFEELKTS